MRFALAHAEQPSLDHLQGVGLHRGQNKKEPIFWRRQGTVFVDGKLAHGARFAIKAPCSHMSLECGLERRKQLLKLVEGQAGAIQELCGTGLHIAKSYTGHTWCLLSAETQHTINLKP